MTTPHPAAVVLAGDLGSTRSVAGGLSLLHRGAVRLERTRRTTHGHEVHATVSDLLLHRVELAWDDTGVDSWCSCDAHPDCAHLAAVVLATFPLAGVEPDTRAAWQRDLDDLLPSVPEQATELCLFVAVRDPEPRHRWAPRRGPHVAVRPGTRGVRGTWIQGNLTWGKLDQLGADPTVVTLLGELHDLAPPQFETPSYYGSPTRTDNGWLPLDTVPSRSLWPLLTELHQRLPVVATGKRQHPVHIDDVAARARATVALRGTQLVVSGEVSHRDAPLGPALLIGEPAVALVPEVDDGRFTIVPLEAPLVDGALGLVARGSAMRIGPDERELFESRYLPRLQQVLPVESPDASYRVPEPGATGLVLHLQHADDRRVHLTWQWDHPSGVPDTERMGALVDAVRDAAGQHAALVLPDGATTPPDRTLAPSAAVLLIAEVVPALRALDGVEVTEDTPAPDYRAATDAPVVTVVSRPGERDWFDLAVTVTVGGETVDFSLLFIALAVGDPVFVLPSGTYFSLDAPELHALRAIIDEARALEDRPLDRLRVSRYQVDLWAELTELGIVAAQEDAWWRTVRALADDAALESVDPPAGLRAELRGYQQTGLSWLHFLRTHGLGGILADDMGLGKTLQTIAMMGVAHQAEADLPPFLVVAPTSVVGNWAAECARFAPWLRVAVVTATEKKRGAALADHVTGAHVVLTSYTLFRTEFDAYDAATWSGLVLDEAQMIKNHSSRGYSCARRLDVPFRLVLTGTPLENNTLELWALASLACPGLLGDRTHFTEYYRHPIEKDGDADRLATLQRRLRPFMLRRTKELVAPDLPAKQEQVLELDLHPGHRRLYDRRLQRERQKILGLIEDLDAHRFQIFRSLTLLRQLALDPALVDEGTAPSAKLDALVDLLTEAAAEGHRVLVLSQFTRFLTSARDRAEAAGLATVYLDGSTTDRPEVISRFRDGDAPAFFISLKAGGFGLNLVEADYVVLLDPWWNPATEAQAIDRAHRIGQTRPVFVYRLVARDTVEAKVMALKEAKSQLFDKVLDGEGMIGSGALTAADIRSLVE